MSYLTIAELKSEYPLVDYSIYSDATLQTLIDKAESKVDDYCEMSFELETITGEVSKAFIDSDNCLVVFPRKRPINSISGLKIVKGSAEVTISLTNNLNQNIYTILETKDRVIFPIGDISLQSVSILDFGGLRNTEFFSKLDYVAGYSTIPNEVREATALYVLDTIRKGANITGASSVSQGGISISYSNNGSSLVKDAERLLAGFKKVTGF